jgi:hypothetical protein
MDEGEIMIYVAFYNVISAFLSKTVDKFGAEYHEVDAGLNMILFLNLAFAIKHPICIFW